MRVSCGDPRTCIRLGFYKTAEEINQVLLCLKKILRCIVVDEISASNSKNSQGSFSIGSGGEDNGSRVVITECRKKVCDILMIITEIKGDNEMKLFISRLKEIAIAQEELKKISKPNTNRRATMQALTLSMSKRGSEINFNEVE